MAELGSIELLIIVSIVVLPCLGLLVIGGIWVVVAALAKKIRPD